MLYQSLTCCTFSGPGPCDGNSDAIAICLHLKEGGSIEGKTCDKYKDKHTDLHLEEGGGIEGKTCDKDKNKYTDKDKKTKTSIWRKAAE